MRPHRATPRSWQETTRFRLRTRILTLLLLTLLPAGDGTCRITAVSKNEGRVSNGDKVSSNSSSQKSDVSRGSLREEHSGHDGAAAFCCGSMLVVRYPVLFDGKPNMRCDHQMVGKQTFFYSYFV